MGTGTGRGAAGKRRAGGGGQNAPKAPRMAQEGVSEGAEPSRTLAGRKPVLGQIWKPEPLLCEGGHGSGGDAVEYWRRHGAARDRFDRLVAALCARRRFGFSSWGLSRASERGYAARMALLHEYGGLPKHLDGLSQVPAPVLERAVESLASYFGLEGASGTLRGAGTVPAEVDPKPRAPIRRKRLEPEGAPW